MPQSNNGSIANVYRRANSSLDENERAALKNNPILNPQETLNLIILYSAPKSTNEGFLNDFNLLLEPKLKNVNRNNAQSFLAQKIPNFFQVYSLMSRWKGNP